MKKRGKNKRGQFFIIFAVILGIIILSTANVFNIIIRTGKENTQKNFDLLCENYKYEIFKISEYSITNTDKEKSEYTLIKEFTEQFVQNSDYFKLIYVYGNQTNISVYNLLGEDIIITFTATSITIPKGEFQNFGGVFSEVTIEKFNKHYDISKDKRFWFVALIEKDGEEYICE